MSADFISASLAMPLDPANPDAQLFPDFEAGRAALEAVTDPGDFHVDIDESFEDDLDEILPARDPSSKVRDDAGVPLIWHLKPMAQTIISQLEEELDSRTVDVHRIGGYRVFVTGELSWGDLPEGVARFSFLHRLPDSVVTAMGIAVDPTQRLG